MNESIINWLAAKQEDAKTELKMYERMIEAVRDGDEAQAYRVPQKVRITVCGDRECPRCESLLYSPGAGYFKVETAYCSHCGQALDWTEA